LYYANVSYTAGVNICLCPFLSLVPDPSRLEVEIAIAKLKRYKSPGSDEILAELIQAGSKILLPVIGKCINSVWNKEELPE
jgi:hypothetical protein